VTRHPLRAALLILVATASCRADVAPPREGPPARVIALAPNLAELVAFAGGTGRLVARTRFTDHPPELTSLPEIGDAFEPDLEALLAVRPDRVLLLSGWEGGPVAGELKRLGIPVRFFSVETEEDVIATVEALGRELGLPEAGDRAGELHAAAEALRRLPPAPERVLMLNGRRPLVASGPGSWGDTLIRLAGRRNALEGNPVRYPVLDRELVLSLDPDVLVDLSGAWEGGQGWSDLAGARAVRAGHAFTLSHPSLLRPGPRFPEAAALLRGVLDEGRTP